MKIKYLLVIAMLLLFSVPATVNADMFCDSYGVKCYKKFDKKEGYFVDHLFSPDGDYQGSIHLTDGQCYDFWEYCCQACDKDLVSSDWDKMCNEKFVECEGQCFAE